MTLKPTPGEWIARGRTVFPEGQTALSIGVAEGHRPEAADNAALWAEAGTAFARTGKSPVQLAEDRTTLFRFLLALVQECAENFNGRTTGTWFARYKEAEAFLVQFLGVPHAGALPKVTAEKIDFAIRAAPDQASPPDAPARGISLHVSLAAEPVRADPPASPPQDPEGWVQLIPREGYSINRTHRLRVPGGWIYKYESQGKGGAEISTCFVPDPPARDPDFPKILATIIENTIRHESVDYLEDYHRKAPGFASLSTAEIEAIEDARKRARAAYNAPRDPPA